MALQNDTSRIQYNGNNSTTSSYAIPFVFFENAHIKCVVTSSAGVDTTLALGSGFNVTGAANANGGSLTTTTAVPTSSKVTIFRNVPATQTTSYQEGGDFPAASHERALDKLTMIAQQTKRLADRALKVPETQNNPNDLPNAGTGNRLLGSNNGTITWEDNRQLPAYPATGGTQALVTAGAGSAPSWQTMPAIATGPITAVDNVLQGGTFQGHYATTRTSSTVNSSTPIFTADRFGDVVNVRDFGAAGNGIADDWLPIQRAIYAATNNSADAATLTDDLSIPANVIFKDGRPTPKLYSGQGHRAVFFPWGVYRITKPIIIGHGTTLIGTRSQRATIIVDPSHTGAAIEDIASWHERTYWDQQPYNVINPAAQFGHFDAYAAGMTIEGLAIKGHSNMNVGTYTDPNAVGMRVSGYDWKRYPVFGSHVTTAVGSAGSTTVTLSHSFREPIGPRLKQYVRFANHNTQYEVVSYNVGGTQLTITPALTSNVPTNTVLLHGVHRHAGIRTCTGEDSFIRNVSCHNFDVGIHLVHGSPASTIQDASCWNCDVGFWTDVSPATMIKPSGDGNNTLIRVGTSGVVNIIGVKGESGHAATFRCLIEGITQKESNIGCINIVGGTFNSATNIPANSAVGSITSIIDVYLPYFQRPGCVSVTGFNSLISTGHFFRQLRANDGTVERAIGTNDATDGGNLFTYGAPGVHIAELVDLYPEAGYHGRLVPRSADTSTAGNPRFTGAGWVLDNSSGIIYPAATWTRSGQTVTVNLSNHKLAPGDYVYIPGSGLTYPDVDSNGLHNAYFSGTARVHSVTNANTFTLFSNNAGPANGTHYVYRASFTEFHAIHDNAHRFQMPNVLGSQSLQRIAFGFYDKLKRLMAGLRVAAENQTSWWTISEFAMGGAIDAPAVRVLHGATAPSATAPNGSLYLRTDGDASTTLYVRASGAWKPLASYDP